MIAVYNHSWLIGNPAVHLGRVGNPRLGRRAGNPGLGQQMVRISRPCLA